VVRRTAEPGAGEQAAKALNNLSAAIARDDEDFDAETVTRAFLASSAALSAKVTGVALDVHEVNTVYAYRDRFELTPRERFVIGRTMCQHGLLAPGWRALAGATTVGDIVAIALAETSSSIRVGALRELGTAGFRAGATETATRFENIDVLDVYLYLDTSEEAEVRAAVADLLPQSGLVARELLLALIAGGGDVGAHRLLVGELISSDPTAACDLVAEAPMWLEPDPEQRLLARACDVGEPGLQALDEAGKLGERLAQRLRARSGRLDLSPMIDQLTDDDAQVRRHALESLVDAGVAIPPRLIAAALTTERDTFAFDSDQRKELELRALQLHTVEELMTYVSWLDSKTGPALQAAARRDDGAPAIERARRIARDGPMAERLATIEREVTASDEPVARRAAIGELAEQFGEFLDSQLLENALDAIAERVDPDRDAELARPHTESADIFASRTALRILAACGDPRDLRTLVSGLDAAHGALHDVLSDGAMRAAPSMDELLDLVAALTDAPERHFPAILRLATSSGREVSRERLRALFEDADDDIRVAAVGRLIALESRESLEQTLDAYVEGDHYRYYNVIGILDRVLYAPDAIAEETRARIA
jgi:hypothetical protein